MKKLIFLLVVMSSLGMSGCVVYDADAHANYDVDVRASWGVGNYYYDPHFGVYVSYGYPSSYWVNGYYYYFSGSHWMRANHWHGPWLTVAPKFVPSRVHGYRTQVHAHPERYPRVQLRPNTRYSRYEGRDVRDHREAYRGHGEERAVKNNSRYPQQASGDHRQEGSRRGDNRAEQQPRADAQTAGKHRSQREAPNERGGKKAAKDSHREHREAPKKTRPKQKSSESSEGNRRSYD
jgi:hypothetical protein